MPVETALEFPLIQQFDTLIVMTESKAMILGCEGLELTPEERTFYAEHRPFGFILFGRNVQTRDQIADLVSDLRACPGCENAPVFIDQEGGRVQRLREPLVQNYPSGATLGRLYQTDKDAGIRAAWIMSRLHAVDLMPLGINVDCLPVLDIPIEGGHDVIGNRAYGRTVEAVTDLGRAAADGLKAGGMLPVMKHVPGHGRAECDSHKELPRVEADIETLRGQDFAPFKTMRDELMAMTAHLVYAAIDPDNPATTSPTIISSIIRGEIGFDGLLMSDDLSMEALSGDFATRTRAIFAGGCDVVLHCNGVMAQMKDVVANTPLLSGEAERRAKAVLAGFANPDDSDEESLRQEFAQLTGALA